MSLTETLVAFLWPRPPAEVSNQSKVALKADLKAARKDSSMLGDQSRMGVDVWTRHRDNLARAENRAYLGAHAKTFAGRWACIGVCAWGLAWMAEGWLWIEVPLTLAGAVAGLVAIAFVYTHRSLNRGHD